MYELGIAYKEAEGRKASDPRGIVPSIRT